MRVRTIGVALAAVGVLAAGGVASAKHGGARPVAKRAVGPAARIDLTVPTKPFAFLPGQVPGAGGSVIVRPGASADRITVRVHDLPPNSDYVVFFTQTAATGSHTVHSYLVEALN